MAGLAGWLRAARSDRSAAPAPADPPPDAAEASSPPTDPVRTVLLGGVETVIEGDPSDPYFQQVEHEATALNGLAALIDSNVPVGSCVVDVGANIGLSTILLARRAARVFAFEPSPVNVALLRANLERNGIGNVDVIASGVSSRAGTLRFHVATFGAGSHVVAPGHLLADNLASIEVPAVALDDAGLPPVTFLKLDAEGHEPDILAGARRLLAEHAPLVYAEINVWCLSAFAGHSPGAFVRALWQAFDVGRPTAVGQIEPLADGYVYLHDIIVNGGGIGNVALRPKPGVPMPNLPELTWPAAAVAALSSR